MVFFVGGVRISIVIILAACGIESGEASRFEREAYERTGFETPDCAHYCSVLPKEEEYSECECGYGTSLMGPKGLYVDDTCVRRILVHTRNNERMASRQG